MKLRDQVLRKGRRDEDRLQQFIKANLGLRKENSILKRKIQVLKIQNNSLRSQEVTV